MEKEDPNETKILQNALAAGTIVGYGSDSSILHGEEDATHDSWWSATSIAGTLHVLDALQKGGSAGNPVLANATKHHDNVWVSEHYHWRSGSWKGAYSYASLYLVKADAPDNTVDVLSEQVLVPIFEKLLAEGTIVEYEIDTQAVHSDDPNLFALSYICPTAEGIDKVQAAIRDSIKSVPLGAIGFMTTIDWAKHRDYLLRTNASYK